MKNVMRLGVLHNTNEMADSDLQMTHITYVNRGPPKKQSASNDRAWNTYVSRSWYGLSVC